MGKQKSGKSEIYLLKEAAEPVQRIPILTKLSCRSRYIRIWS